MNDDVLKKVSRIYDLVTELNVVTAGLKGLGVEVYMGSSSGRNDPLGLQAVVRFSLTTEALRDDTLG